MLLRTTAVWLVILVMAVMNGAARELIFTPRFGAYAGHVISTVILSVVVFLAARGSIVWIGAGSTREAFVVGSAWLLLTVAFEFLAGHYVLRNPWRKLLADYNILRGRIWVVVLLSTLLAPVWARWQQR